jgi:hypothetical protein
MAMRYFARVLTAMILLVTFVCSISELPGCGPFFAEAVFTEKVVPPLPDYYRGRLGVLQPTFAHKYLFVAYRYLTGRPLREEELAAMSEEPESSRLYSGGGSPAVREWIEARSRIRELSPQKEILIFRSGRYMGEWRSFLNCSEDAFRTAASTLGERIKLLGVGHPGIKSWAVAQDIVFSNCSGGAAIPNAAEADLPQILKYDRAYQIAAAHFYSENYDTAAEMFRAIAADSSSQWSRIAPYLVARCLVRKATVPQKHADFDRHVLMEAEQELLAIQKDKKRAAQHAMAGRLQAFVQIRLHPLDHIRTLAERLQKPAGGSDFGQNLADYQYLMDNFNAEAGFTPESARRTNEMTDWILSLPSTDPAHSVESWRATGGLPWLLASLSQLHAGGPDAPAVMDAARKLPKDSPAFATARYHRIRLLMELLKENEARAELDELLPGFRASLPNSSLNLFLVQRLQLARSLDEFLEFAPRIPQALSWDYFPYPELEAYRRGNVPMFDRDSVQVLNSGLPLSYLHHAAQSKLQQVLRNQLICAVWTRAILIADPAVSRSLAAELERVSPDLGPDLRTWREATDAESKQFAAAMLLLHFPGMTPYLQSGVPARVKLTGIDSFRQNWWCGFNAKGELGVPIRYYYPFGFRDHRPPEPAKFPAFLTESDKAEFMLEWKKLKDLPTAPDYFGKVVLPWSAKHPGDERVPEALYLVVKSTRFGCTDSETGRYSRSAFRLLHSKYPNSPWAKSTPYWYGSSPR